MTDFLGFALILSVCSLAFLLSAMMFVCSIDEGLIIPMVVGAIGIVVCTYTSWGFVREYDADRSLAAAIASVLAPAIGAAIMFGSIRLGVSFFRTGAQTVADYGEQR